ncbi:MAG: hypothetical protein HYT93_02845 [Parcubacteria group bacterium]|nr:hypothetical protein [Parcubacteria group bacterium]
MAQYSRGQINTLKELRKILFEHGFGIYNILKRYRKHSFEFIAVKTSGTLFESAVIRLWRGKVRIQFLEMDNAWDKQLVNQVLSLERKNQTDFSPVFFGKTFRNNHNSHLPSFYWHEFTYKREMQKTGLENVAQQFKNAGIVLKKGSRALS